MDDSTGQLLEQPVYYLELLAEPSENSALHGVVELLLVKAHIAAPDPKSAHRQLRNYIVDYGMIPGDNESLLKWVQVTEAIAAFLNSTHPLILTEVMSKGFHWMIVQPLPDSNEWPDVTDKVVSSVIHQTSKSQH